MTTSTATSPNWTVGLCANCDSSLDPLEHAALYCSERCSDYAKDVRYFRRCKAEGRHERPDVRLALETRLAQLLGGGYPSGGRRLPADVRRAVLAANKGRCCGCNRRRATEVDHIHGSSSDRSNLQGLCASCHQAKTELSMRPLGPEHADDLAAFKLRVDASPATKLCDDETKWPELGRSLMADATEWAVSEQLADEAGYFGDGSTGTIEDIEHGWYMQQVMERD